MPASFRHPAVQRLRLLSSKRAARWDERRFVIEGPKLLAEAAAAGAFVDTVFVESGHPPSLDAPVVEVQEGVLARASDARTSQGIAAIVEMVDVPLPALPALVGVSDPSDPSGHPDPWGHPASAPPLAVVCVDLQDPGNAGTVLRGAAASGAVAVVFSGGAVDVYNPKAVRASAGAVFHVPVTVVPKPEEALDELAGWGLRRVATDSRSGRDYTDTQLSGPLALVFGSESHGLAPSLASHVDETVRIPMQRGIESLNVAMAATVLCFEASRQRQVGT